MQGFEYWIGTFLSRPDEVAAAALAVAAFALTASWFTDKEDGMAVVSAVILLGTSLAILGGPIASEWHYWFGGGVFLAGLVIGID